ncbi:MAG: preprotein translocase subunit YajC [Planctomycetaceae bacterium]|jgi:preprotein translocase subunit YajC|nr:preprotein translocase subunit YajC [Planctomycetaceae bacterium]
MNIIFSNVFAIFAQATPANPPANQDGGFWQLIAILGVIVVMLWFFMIRPQQRQEDATRKMIDSLKQNDKVYTVGGVIGIVHSIDKDKNEIVLKVDEANGTKIRFAIPAVQGKVEKEKDQKSS